MRRAVIAIGWIALVLGWWLVWRGEGVWGCGFVALFALTRLATARPRARAELAAMTQAETPAAPLSPKVDRPIAVFAPPADDGFTGTLPLDPDSDSAARWRRLVWVSYGNAFLQGAIGLEDWYRHSLTWPAVCQFRDGADRRLMAEDGFAWLSELRQRGALRISLDVDESVPPFGGIQRWDAQAVTCHFSSHRERWRMGEEVSEAERAAQRLDDWEVRRAAYPLWGYGGYLPAVDAYWRVADLPGVDALAPTDWAVVRAAMDRALQGARFGYEPDDRTLDAPFFQHVGSEEAWAHFPVLPNDPALQTPHRLLNELTRRKAAFDNGTHPKNDNGFGAQAWGDSQAEAAIEAHGRRLSAWMGHVQRLAGSETRWQPRDVPTP